jgi:hypothetical protein
MLNKISWQSYLTILGFICASYYLCVSLLYYSRELRLLLHRSIKFIGVGNSTHLGPGINQNGNSNDQSDLSADNIKRTIDDYEEVEADLFPLAYSLVDQVKIIIRDAARRKLVAQELILAIQLLLKKHPYNKLKRTAFSVSIKNVVELESKKECSIALSDDELNMLWNS